MSIYELYSPLTHVLFFPFWFKPQNLPYEGYGYFFFLFPRQMVGVGRQGGENLLLTKPFTPTTLPFLSAHTSLFYLDCNILQNKCNIAKKFAICNFAIFTSSHHLENPISYTLSFPTFCIPPPPPLPILPGSPSILSTYTLM